MRTSSLLLGAAAFAAAAFVGTNGQAVTAADNDAATLQYALVLERLESAFYNAGQAKFSAANFTAAGYTELDYSYFNLIRDHEKAHVDFLTSTSVLGSKAYAACTYTLKNSLDSVQSYVATAAVLEGVGVSAYDGAINSITDPSTQQVAATIATVEARHSAYLNKLVGTTPPPNGQGSGSNGALDAAVSPADTLTAASSFVTSCPFDLSLVTPQVRPGGVYTDSVLSAFKKANANPLASTNYTQAQYDNDNLALNYALVLENLEAAFYKAGQAKFSSAAFESYFASTGINGTSVYSNFDLIAAHEAAHAAFLTTTVNTRAPGTAAPACTYDFSSLLTDIPTYVKSANTLESTGVSAYDGAVNAFTDTKIQQAAATVATIEARHTSYINLVLKLGGITTTAFPFPGDSGTQVTDTPLAPATVLAAVTALKVQTCSFTPVLPATPLGGASSSSSSSSSTGDNGDASAHAPAMTLMVALFAAAVAALRM